MATAAEAPTRKKIVIESAEAVFGLPWFVARDYTVKDEGLEIEIILPGIKTKFDWSDPRARDHHLVSATNFQKAFEEYRADIYRACEWGQIRRTYDHKRKGPIVGKRPAMVFQGIFVRPDSPINTPVHLAGKTIGVQYHQGSHYTTLSMVGGLPRSEQIELVHTGTAQERYEAMMDGETDATTLMEPWVTLAEKNGCKLLMGTHYQGLENVAAEVPQETYDRLLRAVKKAVRLINADKKKYIHYMIDELPEKYAKQITPDDFHLPRLRYVDPAPYTQEEFDRTYEWMLARDLVAQDADYGELVCNLHP